MTCDYLTAIVILATTLAVKAAVLPLPSLLALPALPAYFNIAAYLDSRQPVLWPCS